MTDRPTNQPKHGLGMHRELTLPITNLLRPVAPLHITDYASLVLISPLKILNVCPQRLLDVINILGRRHITSCIAAGECMK